MEYTRDASWLKKFFLQYINDLDKYVRKVTANSYMVIENGKFSRLFKVVLKGDSTHIAYDPDGNTNYHLTKTYSFLMLAVIDDQEFQLILANLEDLKYDKINAKCLIKDNKLETFFVAISPTDDAREVAEILNSGNVPVLDLSSYRGKLLGTKFGL